MSSDPMAPKALRALVVSTKAMGEALGLSARRVSQLEGEEGVLRKLDRNAWPLLENLRRYREHLAAKAADDSPEFKAEQARLYRARADMAERDSARQAGNLVPAAQVEAAVGELIVTARNHLAAVPAKVAARFPNPGAALPIIEEGVRDALEALADREIESTVSEATRSG